MSSRFKILFYLKKRGSYTGGPIPIYLRVTAGGGRIEVSTQRECEPERWNAQAGRMTGTKQAVKELNSYLDTLQIKVYEAQRLLREKGEEISAATIKEILSGKKKRSKMLIEVFKYHNEQMSQLVNIDFAEGTMERYETALSHTKDFIQWKYGGDGDLEVDQLNYEFIADMEFYLKTVRKCSHNTTMKYLSNMKKIVNLCVKHGWLSRDPFAGYKIIKREVIRAYLTKEELEAVCKKDFDAARLALVRDIFVFSCYTGLSYADIEKLKRSEIVIGIDGKKWISTTRQKTETQSKIPLLPIAIEILERYRNHPKCVNQDLLLPILSNQNMNGYLKEIADMTAINKKLTFHCARHTFATTVTLTNGVPIESVSKMLGHRNLKTTQHYAKIVDRKVSEDMDNLQRKLEYSTENHESQKRTGSAQDFSN